MPAKSAKSSHGRVALLLGLAATLLVLAGHMFGALERLELQSLDLRFRHLSTAPPNDRLLHVDIDDRSLEELGRWPWPRAQLAGIVEILSQAGARSVALDIVMPDPQPTRFVSEAADFYSADSGELLGELAPRAVFDDEALAAAMRTTGRVFLPMHVELYREQIPADEAKLAMALAEKVPIDTPPAQLAAAAGVDQPPSSDVLHRVRASAIEMRVNRAFYFPPGEQRRAALAASAPSKPASEDAGERASIEPASSIERISFAEVLRIALPGLPEGQRGEDFDMARRAYLRFRAMLALQRFQFGRELAGYPLQAGRLTPPLVTLAEACYSSGFVTVEPDADGVVRRIPMLVVCDAGFFPQFALSMAMDELAGEHGGSAAVSSSATTVSVKCADGFTRTIPVDSTGCMLINWIRRSDDPRHHIAAAKIGSLWLEKQALERSARLERLLSLKLIELAESPGDPRLKDMYFELASDLAPRSVELEQRLTAARAQAQGEELFSPGKGGGEEIEKLQAEVRQADARIDAIYAEFRAALMDPAALDAFLSGSRDQAQRRERARFLLGRLDQVAQKRGEIERSLADGLADIRRLVEGKLCLVGSTATGAADFVPTPINKQLPGVVVHSNILNTIVSGAFVRAAGPLAGAAAVILVGLAVTLLAARRPILQAAPLALLVMAVYAAGNALIAFRAMSLLLPLVAPLAAAAAAFTVVTAYRQLTEERDKRHIRGMFAHALSPALVDRLMEDPSLARLGGERRELTFLFSDLQGFTPLSERLGEQGTVKLLNRYFDRMTEVIQNRRGGYLNKFLGDGLFVFFGAPVLQADHAARAIRAALDCQQQVAELNAELAAELGGTVQLTCRVGVATGNVMVGNCGSSQRMDYTAIGDPVNLASRLESANKFFGTRILVADEAWRQGGQTGDILARPLGEILVVGKNEPVKVWHLAGLAGDADENTRAAYADFARAVELLQARRFAEAAKLFEDVAGRLGDDKPARILREHALACQAAGEGAQTALRLTEK